MAADIIQYILTWWHEVLLPFINWIVQVFGPYWEKIFEGVVNVVKDVYKRQHMGTAETAAAIRC